MAVPTIKRELRGITAVISGAGIGGLVAALEFWRRGIDVRILERTSHNATVGDCFLIGPSALRLLDNWPQMRLRHDEIVRYPPLAKCNHRGERLTEPLPMTKMFNMQQGTLARIAPPAQHFRPKFHAMLLEQLLAVGIEVEYGKEVVEYHEDDKLAKGGVTLEDGTVIEADIVVAADGLRGASSHLVMGHDVPAKSSGSAVYRCAYPVELALKDPVIAERFPLSDDGNSVFENSVFELWIGAGMFGTFWRDREQFVWSVTHPDTKETAAESWSSHATPADVKAFTSTIPGWPEVADRVIAATPDNTLIDWKLMWRDPQPKWTSPAGHVVQLGDAAHTFLPSSGNGATQAIEDGISLAACVARAGPHNIPNATRVHNLLRFERVSFLQALGIARRDERVNTNSKNKPKPPPTPGKWLYEHDAATYVDENYDAALTHLRDGTEFRNTNRPVKVKYHPWTIEGLVQATERGEETIVTGDWS